MKQRAKNIYLEPLWKMHSMYQSLVKYPPQGYEFITPQTTSEGFFKSISKLNLSYSLLGQLYKIVPMHLIKSYLGRFNKIPEADLTYSCEHLVFRKEPWIIDLEFVYVPIGSAKHLKRYKGILERSFASEYCKKIICRYESAKKTVLSNLDCTGFEHKLEPVYQTVVKKDFTKQFNNDKVKLLFVGSANILGEFWIKGGADVIETFLQLNREYDNLELVIRSDMPQKMKDKCKHLDNIKIIDKVIRWEELEQEFKSADIFLLPAYNAPTLAFLDAMSYELPVVTIDSWANSELVEAGKTGLVVPKSDMLRYLTENFRPSWDSPPISKAIKTPDTKMVQALVEKISILIENPELRRQMGKAGRWEVEQGKFSIESRNEKLKRIFDEATA